MWLSPRSVEEYGKIQDNALDVAYTELARHQNKTNQYALNT